MAAERSLESLESLESLGNLGANCVTANKSKAPTIPTLTSIESRPATATPIHPLNQESTGHRNTHSSPQPRVDRPPQHPTIFLNRESTDHCNTPTILLNQESTGHRNTRQSSLTESQLTTATPISPLNQESTDHRSREVTGLGLLQSEIVGFRRCSGENSFSDTAFSKDKDLRQQTTATRRQVTRDATG